MKFNALDWIAFTLVLVGSLNWGLIGLFEYNLIEEIFGEGSNLPRIIYVLVGLAGLYTLYALSKPYSVAHRIDYSARVLGLLDSCRSA